ncbi:MAG: IPExxxVDY family protein [Leeuwenhoekiella sp.]
MATIKMVLDDALDYDFELIAIHCSFEDYKMAYHLNAALGLRLKREVRDIDFEMGNFFALYSRFIFENPRDYVTYTLISNKCKAKQINSTSTSGLFPDFSEEPYKYVNLLPELKTADYLFKIEAAQTSILKKSLLLSLNKIPQLVTAYTVPVNTLKFKKNLIFE